MTSLPLEGIRIVDLGLVAAMPYATMVLADMGAEVIRVETTQVFSNQTRGVLARPTREMAQQWITTAGGYPGRDPGERPWNRYPFFNYMARNKLGMTVDLRQPSGLEVFGRLVQISDAVMENNTPSSLERMGITYEWLRGIKPDIVFVRLSSFGQTGPCRDYRAFGLQTESFCGHDLLRRYRDRDPSHNSWAVPSDHAGGMSAAMGCMMALIRRRRTGRGELVDVSMVETFLNDIGHIVMDYTMNGRVQESLGNRDRDAVQGAYRCRGDDRWIALTIATDEHWRGFIDAAGNPAWGHDPRFDTVCGRIRNQDALDPLIESWTLQHEHRAAAAILQSHGVPAGPVLDDADAYEDPHLQARGFFVRLNQADCGAHLYPGPPWKLSAASIEMRHPPVRLGEHNEYIYKNLLGYSDQEYRELEGQGHIGTEYASNIP
ncbi:MAG TPA: CoA transferase [Candidatus Binataceae bacterium]|jgi:crotonobetainyl-CoA:carnitine CoA-transferase CaiB-like acyl-CoA transferase